MLRYSFLTCLICFFEKSLEEWDIEKIRAYQGKGKIPYERVIDKENTEICFVRRREQKIVAESILSETDKSQKGSFLLQKRNIFKIFYRIFHLLIGNTSVNTGISNTV